MNEDSLFAAAIAISDDSERRDFLDRECGKSSPLREQIEQLLDLHGQTSPLDRPVQEWPTEPILNQQQEACSENVGTVIGHYKLLEKIGEGGFGLVFVAEQQEPVRRRVAVKLIKPGMDSKQVIGRFEAERQALAMMDHQNIAKVLDAGTTDNGRPYFVMELVHGTPINSYCDENHLTPRQRLELFIPVCQAIQHAHQKGIIHRDIKPSNVLVTMYDDRAVPKVIDFGISKALDQQLTDKSVYTQYGTMVGTLEYVSPEQAEMNAFGVDTRSDVYSLGAMLYELLTGTPPFERANLRLEAYAEMLRIIKEQEPSLPSVRIHTSEALKKVAADRCMEPARLSSEVRGELDWIVMRCLEKDRTRRYEGAGSLARDIQRFLANEPVHACPPTLGYRVRKTYQKNRSLVWTVAFVATVLVVACAVSINMALRASEARDLAQLRHREAEQHALKASDNERLAEDRLEAVSSAREDLAQVEYATSMRLAQHELQSRNLRSVRRLLERVKPSARGWEWHYLNRAVHSEVLSLPGHVWRSRSVSFNNDGTRILTACEEPKACLWDANTGQLLQLFNAPVGDVRSATFDSTGTRVLIGTADAPNDGEVRLFDANSGREILVLPDHGPTNRLMFNSAGTQIATSCSDGSGSVRIWDASTGTLLHHLQLPPSEKSTLYSLYWGGHGLLATGHSNGAIHLWNTTDWKYQKSIGKRDGQRNAHAAGCQAIAFNADETLLVSVGNDAKAIVWNVATGNAIQSLLGHENEVRAAAFSPNGKWIATGCDDRIARIYRAATGELVRQIVGHEHEVRSIAFSPDGGRLVTGSSDGTAKVWSLDLDTAWPVMKGFPKEFVGDITPDGERLIVHSNDDHVLWDRKRKKEILRVPRKDGENRLSVWPSGNGNRLLGLARDYAWWRADPKHPTAEVKVWDAATGQQLNAFQINKPVYMSASNRNGNMLVASTYLGEVTLWDTTTGEHLARLNEPGVRWFRFHFSADDRLLVGASVDGDVAIWNTEDGKLLQKTKVTQDNVPFVVAAVAFNSDASLVAAGCFDGSIKIWNVGDAKLIRSLPGHSGRVSSLQFSPDGSRILTSSVLQDQTARLWDVESGLEVLSVRLPPFAIPPVFHPDGSKFLFATRDYPLQVVDASPLDGNPVDDPKPRESWYKRYYSAAQRALWDATNKGDLAKVVSAIEEGANVNAMDTRSNPRGRRALNYAVKFNRTDILDALINAGADVDLANHSGFTAIHHASEYRAAAAAERLVSAGADLTRKTRDGRTPLDVADDFNGQGENEQIVKLIRDALRASDSDQAEENANE